MVAAWPEPERYAEFVNDKAEKDFELAKRVISCVRSTRARYRLSPRAELDVCVRWRRRGRRGSRRPRGLRALRRPRGRLRCLRRRPEAGGLRLRGRRLARDLRPRGRSRRPCGRVRARLAKELAKAEKDLAGVERTLANEASSPRRRRRSSKEACAGRRARDHDRAAQGPDRGLRVGPPAQGAPPGSSRQLIGLRPEVAGREVRAALSCRPSLRQLGGAWRPGVL